MNLRILSMAIASLSGAVALPSCESTGAEPTGLTRYEREEAFRRRPLTTDPNSEYRDVMINDGAVGLKIGEF